MFLKSRKPFSISFEAFAVWTTFNHPKNNSTKFTHYRLEIREVIEFLTSPTSPLRGFNNLEP